MSSKKTFAGKMFAALKPCLSLLPDDAAHAIAKAGLRLAPVAALRPAGTLPASLRCRVLGLDFPSPIGIAAGFDKNAQMVGKMLAAGAGFIEVGTITPKAQRGNRGRQLWLLEKEQALINHMGFPNQGVVRAMKRCSAYKKNEGGIVGVNIGANRDSTERMADYVACLKICAENLYAPDYIAINISSPNTEGLRALETVAQLAQLLDRLNQIESGLPLLVKISPDMEDAVVHDIAHLALEKNIAGIIATNTTIKHAHVHTHAQGGLSGAPLRATALRMTNLLYQATKGALPIIGVGGICSGDDVYQRIRAGASLVQLYTALIWHGPDLIAKITHDLAHRLTHDGFSSVAQAVGSDYNSTD